MKINNDNIPFLNYEMAKNNLKKAMEHLGIKQKDIVSLLNKSQSDISKKLNSDNDKYEYTFFNLEELFEICCAYGLSIDEITGLEKLQDKTSTATLSDACEALCNLHRIMPLDVSTAEIETITVHKNSTLEPEKKTRTVLFSQHQTCDQMIDEFKKVSSISPDMLSLWENNYKEKHTNELKKYGFCSEGEHFYKWIKHWLDELTEQASNIYIAQIESPHSHTEDTALKAGITHAELIYSVFERALKEDINILYNAIDSYIKINNIPASSIDYIALNLFKKVYNSKNNKSKNS